jgi:hypothetical protein
MRRYTAEFLLSFYVHYLSKRVKAADEGTVRMHSAASCGEEDAAGVSFDAQDGAALFGIFFVELRCGQAEVSGQAKRFIGRNQDGLVIAAGAADLAFE